MPRADAERAIALATEQVLPYWAAIAMVPSGWALVKTGQAEEGLARLRAGINSYRATGAKVYDPQWLALLAEACIAAGRVEEGLSAVREALAVVQETGARIYEAELKRLEGELLLASAERDESGAEAAFRRAIAIARGQEAKSWELRSATSRARLLTRQGRREEARDLLAPICGWFTEGFDTRDLKEAKALLDELVVVSIERPVDFLDVRRIRSTPVSRARRSQPPDGIAFNWLGGAGEELTSGLRRPITAPCGSLN